MNSVKKGKEGENFVNEIAFNSFLKYWCYPSPEDERGDKKEICDLLITFDDIVIIISVKNYTFKENHQRYFRNTIDKAVRQIYGAERKIIDSNRSIYIKHPDKAIEKIDKNKIKKVFRVIVNLGSGVAFYPFNQETKSNKFISIFDKAAFEIIMKELDTIPDFIDYLEKREKMFFDKQVIVLPNEKFDFSVDKEKQFGEYINNNSSKNDNQKVLLSGTEFDLLGQFLINNRNFPELIKSDEYKVIFLNLNGEWDSYLSRKQVFLKKELDKYSYFIDFLVKDEILIHNSSYHEEIAKEFLSFNRFHRRIITKVFFDFYDFYNNNKTIDFARRYGDINGIGIIFIYFDDDNCKQESQVDVFLELALNSFSLYTKYINANQGLKSKKKTDVV